MGTQVKTNAAELYRQASARAAARKAAGTGEIPGASVNQGQIKTDYNLLEKGLGTFADISDKISRGATSSVEGILDFVIGGAAMTSLPVVLNSIAGGDWADRIKDVMAYDATGAAAGWINSTTGLDKAMEASIQTGKVGQAAQKIETAVGAMLPAVAASIVTGGAAAPAFASSAAEVASLVTLGLGAAGNAAQEAYQDGAGAYAGLGYGAASGAVEVATEKMFGGVGKAITGAGFLNPVVSSIAPKLGEMTSHGLGRIAASVVEEGLEEVASDAVNPLIRTIYKGGDALNEYKNPDYYKGMAESFALGAGTSLVYSGTVGAGLSRAGIGNVGKAADVEAMAEDIRGLDETMDNLRQRGHLTEARAAEMEGIKRSQLQRMSETLSGMSESRRSALMEKMPALAQTFEADGSLRAEAARRAGIGVEGTAASLKAAYFKGDRTAVAETLDRVGARQVTELTESERAPYQAFVRQTESFGKRLGEAAPSWTVVESMPSDMAAYDRKTNTILLSREALASEDTTAEALRQSWFGVTVEEYMHRLNNSDSGRSYAEMFGLFSRTEQDAVLDRLVEDGYLDEYADSRSEQRKLLDRVLNKNELTAEEQRVQDMLYDEMLAHLMRDELSTKHFYKMVAEKKPGLLQGLLDHIRAFGKGTGAVGEAVSERAAKAEKLFTDALSEVGYEVSAGKVVGIRDEDDGEVRKSNDGTNIRYAKKPTQTDSSAFEEAVRRSGLDFDDQVMAETRAEAEAREAAQYRAERSGTAAQTGVDKSALRSYVGKKTVANAVGRAVRAMKDMNTIIGEGFTETEIASLTKAAEEGLSESLWIDVNNAHSSREMERAVDRVVESALQQSRLRVMAGDTQTEQAERTVTALKRYTKKLRLDGIVGDIRALYDDRAGAVLARWRAPEGVQGVSPDQIADELADSIGVSVPADSPADILAWMEDELSAAQKVLRDRVTYVLSDAMTDEAAQETRRAMRETIMQGLRDGLMVTSVEEAMNEVLGTARRHEEEALRRESASREFVEARLRETAADVKRAREQGRDDALRAYELGRAAGDARAADAEERMLAAFERRDSEVSMAQASAALVAEGIKVRAWSLSKFAKAHPEANPDGLREAARLMGNAVTRGSVSVNEVRDAAEALRDWMAASVKDTGWVVSEDARQVLLSAYDAFKTVADGQGTALTAKEMQALNRALKVLRAQLGTSAFGEAEETAARATERAEKAREESTDTERYARASGHALAEAVKANMWNIRAYAEQHADTDVDGLRDAAHLLYKAGSRGAVSVTQLREAAMQLDAWIADNMEKTGWIADDGARQEARRIYRDLYGVWSGEGTRLTADELESVAGAMKWMREHLGTMTVEQLETEAERYKGIADAAVATRMREGAYSRAFARLTAEANRTRQWRVNSLTAHVGVDAAGLADAVRLMSNAVTRGTSVNADGLRSAAMELGAWIATNAEAAGWLADGQVDVVRGVYDTLVMLQRGSEGSLTVREMEGAADALAFLRERIGTQNLAELYEQTERYRTQAQNAIDASRESAEYTRRLGHLQSEAMRFKNWANGAFVNQSQVGNQDIFKGSIGRMGHLLREGNISVKAVRKEFATVAEWFEAQAENLGLRDAARPEDGEIADAVLRDMKDIGAGEERLTADELAKAERVLKFLRHKAETYNKVRRNGKLVDAEEVVKPMMRKMELAFEHAGGKNNIAGISMRFMENWLPPEDVCRFYDSYQEGAWYTDAFLRLQQAEINTDSIKNRLTKPVLEFAEKHPKYEAELKKRKMNVGGVTLPADIALSLYMTMHRDQARAGLILSGFEYRDEALGKTVDFEGMTDGELSEQMKAEKADQLIAEITRQMTEEDKAFTAIAKKLFNEDCKRLKSETDMRIYGYTNIIDDFYYPIKRVEKAQTIDESYHHEVNRATNASFNKSTVEGAKNKLRIDPLGDVLAKHVDGIARYAGMAEFIREYDVLYNLDMSGNANNPVTLRTMGRNVWPAADQYMKGLMDSVQGIKNGSNSTVSWLESLRGTYAVFTLGLNAKVLATQFSSMFASTAVLDWADLAAAVRISGKDVDEYCELARLRNEDNGAVLAATVLDEVRGAAGKLLTPIAKTDRLVITRTFAACQAHVARNGGPAIGTKENKEAAGRLMERVVLRTQQNTQKTTRSKGMREGGALQKTLTMFKHDNNMNDGNLISAVGEVTALNNYIKGGKMDAAELEAAKKRLAGAKANLKKALGSLTVTAIYGVIISTLFRKLMHKNDDDITKWSGEDVKSLATELVGNFIGGLPIISEVYNFMVDGWEVDDMSVSAFNDLLSSAKGLADTTVGLVSGETSSQQAAAGIRKLLYAVGEFTGLPTRNINNYLRMVLQLSPDALYKYDNVFREMPYKSDLSKAIEDGDDDRAAMIAGIVLDENTELATHSAVRREMVRLAVSGRDVLPRTVPETVNVNGEAYKLTARQKKTVTSVYAEAGQAAQKMMKSEYYRGLSEDAKLKAMNRIYEAYYNLGVEKAVGVGSDDGLVLMSKAVPVEKLVCILAEASELKADVGADGKPVSGSKKAKVQKYVQGLRLTAAQKWIIYGYLGYSVNGQINTIRAAVQRLRMTANEKQLLAEACGAS